jgi:hypothetical protein
VLDEGFVVQAKDPAAMANASGYKPLQLLALKLEGPGLLVTQEEDGRRHLLGDFSNSGWRWCFRSPCRGFSTP